MTAPSQQTANEDPVGAAAEGADVATAATPPAAESVVSAVPSIENVRGWTKLEVADRLFRLAAAVERGVIVEIGSYRGKATLALAAGSSLGAKVPVFAVDPHEPTSGINGGNFGPEDRVAFFRNVLRAGFARYVRLLNIDSKVAAGGWKEPVALLYIDGDHSREAVASDFAAWLPHLAPDAVVGFGSSGQGGPRRVIDHWMEQGTLVELERVADATFLRFKGLPEGWAPEAPETPPSHPAAEWSDGGGAGTKLAELVPDYDEIEGWLNPTQAEELCSWASRLRNGCIVEIGCHRGKTTIALSAGSSLGAKLPVYAVEASGTSGADRAEFFRNIIKTKLYPEVRLLSTGSEVVTPRWTLPVAALFVEGNQRRYDGVKAEFELWRQHLMADALVIFDDTDFQDVRRLIDDLTRAGELAAVKEIGEIIICRFIGAHAASGDEARAVTSEPREVAKAPSRSAGSQPLWRPRWFHIVNNVYFGHNGAYLYQPITKCACTTIKALLLEFEGLPVDPDEWRLHEKAHNKFPGSGHLSRQENIDMFQGRTNTFKFVIVRNPYSRLASVYADKIRSNSPYWVDKIRNSAAKRGLPLSEDISFAEFVDIVSRQEVQEMDPHWRPQFYEGRFELIKYDFVGHMEHMPDDLIYILEKIGAPPELIARAGEKRNSTGSSNKAWESVPPDIVARYLEAFALDYDVLGYSRSLN